MMLQRFLREARAVAKLKNRHVVRIHDADLLPNGSPFLVMELLDGVDLLARIRAGPVAMGDAVRWVHEACEAMAEAHALGIVHRDLKPGNLFLCNSGGRQTVRVLDFGVSGILDRSSVVRGVETEANVVVGTRAYMAPEQHEGTQNVDVRADVWSLGVILFQLLTGKVPYAGSSAVAVYAAIVSSAPPSPKEVRSDLPDALSNVVTRCLRRDPNDRYASAKELLEALDACDLGPSRNVAFEVSSPALVSETTGRGTRRPRLVWGAAALVAVGVAVLLFVTSRGATHPTATNEAAGAVAPAVGPPASAEPPGAATPLPPPNPMAPAAPNTAISSASVRSNRSTLVKPAITAAPRASTPPGVPPSATPATPPPAPVDPYQSRTSF
jgi:eukaryotic-like serine/threonine-protein kinase